MNAENDYKFNVRISLTHVNGNSASQSMTAEVPAGDDSGNQHDRFSKISDKNT